jgi:hypothetical protein
VLKFWTEGDDGWPLSRHAKDCTATMNSTVSERVIAEAYERDPASAAAEYGAQFRSDVETFLPRELVDAAIGITQMGGEASRRGRTSKIGQSPIPDSGYLAPRKPRW